MEEHKAKKSVFLKKKKKGVVQKHDLSSSIQGRYKCVSSVLFKACKKDVKVQNIKILMEYYTEWCKDTNIAWKVGNNSCLKARQ